MKPDTVNILAKAGRVGMTPDTVHRLAQEIRHERSLITVREIWLEKQAATSQRDEEFRVTAFRKKVIRYAEQELIRQGDGTTSLG